MTPESLLTSALTSSAFKLVAQTVSNPGQYKNGGLENADVSHLQQVLYYAQIPRISPGSFHDAERTVGPPERELSLKQAQLGGAALAIDSSEVFRDARRRISLVFKINLGIAISLATILLGGLGGVVFSAIVFNNELWALAFGGLSAADVIGVYVFKPLTAINAALVSAQRLDGIQLRLHQQLTSCDEFEALEDCIRCQTQVWEAIQEQLAKLA